MELLKKDLGRAAEREAKAFTALKQAQQDAEALRADRADLAQSWRQVLHDRNEARLEVENLKKEIAEVRSEREESLASVSRLTADLADARSIYREASRPQITPLDSSKTERKPFAASKGLIGREPEQDLPEGGVGSGVSDSEGP